MESLFEYTDDEMYYADETRLSFSKLWRLKNGSPADFAETTFEDTEALRFGRLFHAFCLFYDNFEKYIHVHPKLDGRTKAGKDQKKELAEIERSGKMLCSEQELDKLLAMHRSLFWNDRLSETLQHQNRTVELGIGWEYIDEDVGVIKMKSKPDLFNVSTLECVDLKTTKNACISAFTPSYIIRMGYHVQAYMYLKALQAYTGRDINDWQYKLACVEKEGNYNSQVYVLGSDIIDRGREDFLDLMEIRMTLKQNDMLLDTTYNSGDDFHLSLPDYLK